MPNISKIKLPNENTARELKDSTARAVFTPASSSAPGTQGQVPAPSYAEVAAGKFLKADGTWDTPAGGTTPTGDDILLTGYTQGSDTSAVAATDKVNEAIAKHENKIAANQTNILSVEDMICDTEFSTSTAYAVGDIVAYEHGLYKFNTAHSAGAWNSSQVDEVSAVDLISSGSGSGGNSVASKEIYTTRTINQPDTWETKTWSGLTSFNGQYVWSDGMDIYYSSGSTQYVLDRSNNSWSEKTWTDLQPSFLSNGKSFWTDGTDIYYSFSTTQKVLNKSTSTWSDKTWTGLTSIDGSAIWTDGTDIYYSFATTQKVLNKSTSTWSDKTWSGLTSFSSDPIWTDGTDIYYSSGSNQYVLDKSTSTWITKTWSGLTSFNISNVWTDGTDIYYSSSSTQYVLNRATSTWTAKTWSGLTSFSGQSVWTDGIDIYYSNGSTQYVLKRPLKTTKIPDVKNNAQLTALIGDINSVLEAVL